MCSDACGYRGNFFVSTCGHWRGVSTCRRLRRRGTRMTEGEEATDTATAAISQRTTPPLQSHS
jgi:hypothetical protein